MDIGETGLVGVDWIHLAADRGQLWALVNTVVSFVFCKKQGIY
jgi:hypothetical protein